MAYYLGVYLVSVAVEISFVISLGMRYHSKMLVKILRWGLYAAICIPLIIFKDFMSPFHFGKVVMFRALIEVLAVVYVLLIATDRRYLPKITPLFWALTLFTAAFGVTSLTGINVYQSFMGTLERMGGWFTFLHFWVMYVMAISIFRTREDWLRLVQVSLVASLISTFYGFLQKTSWDFVVGSGDRARIFGTIGNTALFAGYTLINLFFALMMALRKKIPLEKDFWLDMLVFIPILFVWGIVSGPFWAIIVFAMLFALWVSVGYGIGYVISITVGHKSFSFLRFLYVFTVITNFVGVIMTAVRGAWLGLIVATIVLALEFVFLATYEKGVKTALKTTFISLAALLVIVQVLLVAAHNTQFVKSSGYLTRLSDFSFKTRLVQTRFWAWQAGIDGWNDSAKTMLLGWGPENFNVPFSLHFNPNFFQGPGSETLFDRAHNMYVEVLVTMGLVGAVTYLGIFVVLFGMLFKIWGTAKDNDDKNFAFVMVAGLVAYMIHNALIFDTSANFIVFFAFSGVVSFFFLTREGALPEKKTVPKALPATLRYSAVLLLGVAFCVLIYKTDIKPVQANYATTRALVASWSKDNVTAMARFRQALAYNTFPAYEIRHQFAQYVLNNVSSFKADQGLDAGKILSETIQEVAKNESYQLDYLPYLYISRIYITLGKSDPKSAFNDLALQNSMKALEISPTFVRTYYEVAQAYLNKQEYVTAAEWFQKSIDLNPSVGLSWYYKGIAQLEGGDEKGLKSIEQGISNGYELTEGEAVRLVPLYAKLKDYPHIVMLYERLIKLGPNNASYHASLAVAYAESQRIDDAVREAHVAAQLDPKFEAQAKQFVEALGRTW